MTTQQERGQATGGPMIEFSFVLIVIVCVYVSYAAAGYLGVVAGIAILIAIYGAVWWINSDRSQGDSA